MKRSDAFPLAAVLVGTAGSVLLFQRGEAPIEVTVTATAPGYEVEFYGPVNVFSPTDAVVLHTTPRTFHFRSGSMEVDFHTRHIDDRLKVVAERKSLLRWSRGSATGRAVRLTAGERGLSLGPTMVMGGPPEKTLVTVRGMPAPTVCSVPEAAARSPIPISAVRIECHEQGR